MAKVATLSDHELIRNTRTRETRETREIREMREDDVTPDPVEK